MKIQHMFKILVTQHWFNTLVKVLWPYWLGFTLGQLILWPFGLTNFNLLLGLYLGSMCPIIIQLFKKRA
jgi:hypothetical protein